MCGCNTETQLMKSEQKNEELLDKVQQLSSESLFYKNKYEVGQTDLIKISAELEKQRTERESLVLQLATAASKLDAQAKQIEYFEGRANEAEARLEEVLRQLATPRRKQTKASGSS